MTAGGEAAGSQAGSGLEPAWDAARPPGPVQRRVEVVAAGPDGAYTRLAVDACGRDRPLPAPRPGQFVALAVGDDPTPMLLRRCFSIAVADDYRWELLIAAHGPGSTWLTRRRPGDMLDLVGPLGRPFPQPAPGAGCVLVAGGYGAAPMVWWGRQLRAAGHRVAIVIGAADAVRLADVEAARTLDVPVLVTTDDGSAGVCGRVTDVLSEAIAAVAGSAGAADGPADEAVEVYACGPMVMLREVTATATELVGGRARDRTAAPQERGSAVRVWCAVEEAMACGIGVCMTCVLPVRGEDGTTRMVRSCVEGPTFAGDAVRWESLTRTPNLLGGVALGASVPSDCLGAPR